MQLPFHSDIFYSSFLLPLTVSIFTSIFTISIQGKIQNRYKKRAFKKSLLLELRSNIALLKELQEKLLEDNDFDKKVQKILAQLQIESESYISFRVKDYISFKWNRDVWEVDPFLSASALKKNNYEQVKEFYKQLEHIKEMIIHVDRAIQESFKFCIEDFEVGLIQLVEIDKGKWHTLIENIENALNFSQELNTKSIR